MSSSKTYRLFLDESGDHGLANMDPHFPVFILCGVVMTEAAYEDLDARLNVIKHEFWVDRKVILHSRDIRKCGREFQNVKIYKPVDIVP